MQAALTHRGIDKTAAILRTVLKGIFLIENCLM